MSGCKLTTSLTALILLLTLQESRSQTVITPQGHIHGTRLKHLNKQVDVYFGIPYALPPVGDLRFQHPVPSKPWSPMTPDIHILPPSCYQPLNLTSYSEEYRKIPKYFSEHCLYLNVWVPVLPHNGTVMVWLHGGNFLEGSALCSLYNGQFMAGESDVIVVSLNYRLGPLGFSYLGNDSIPGNMGLMDQVLALKWIQNNIVHFGGDPNKVTLFGQGAGAASVGFHLLSPLSRDLFNTAILQSGSPTAHWSHNDPARAREQVRKLGNIFGCSRSTDQELMACLQEVDAQQLTESQLLIMTNGLPFLPVVDGYFLPDSPIALLESGNFKKTSILHGVVKDEAKLLLYQMKDVFLPNFTLSQNQYHLLLGSYFRGVNNKIRTDAVTLYYETRQEIGLPVNYLDMLAEIRGDVDYNCPAVDFGSYFSQNNPTFAYSFAYRISTTPYPEWVGVTHGYETEMVFGLPINLTLGFNLEEQRLSWFLMTYWTNFAKSGNPNTPVPVVVNWLPYDVSTRSYMHLDLVDNLENRRGLRHNECVFLTRLLPLIPRMDDISDGGISNVQQNSAFRRDQELQFPDVLNFPTSLRNKCFDEPRENGCGIYTASPLSLILVLSVCVLSAG